MDHLDKRVFFAFETKAPWPEKLPEGRILDERHRHLTLAFLGNINYADLEPLLSQFPAPPFRVGFAGIFNQCLFLPERYPRVVAWHVEWLDQAIALEPYHKAVVSWLQINGFEPDVRDHFLPHVTISRAPFNIRQWKQTFAPLPMVLENIHLFESVGNLKYEPIWSFPLKPPFCEIEHTADIAYLIRGENFDQLQKHAYIALAFKSPNLLNLSSHLHSPTNIEDIVQSLNRIIAHADAERGCPFKAVSYHGEAMEQEDGTLAWEMIVDV
jgi:2'-5' RNA ligase